MKVLCLYKQINTSTYKQVNIGIGILNKKCNWYIKVY
jgi:hypothetical protein